MSARDYFERKRDEALKLESEFAAKRFNSPMRIAGWKADVYNEVLLWCGHDKAASVSVEASVEIERYFEDPYHFTYEMGREKAVKFCMARLQTVGRQAAE